MKNKNLEKFTDFATKDLKFSKQVESWDFKRLADHLLHDVWGDETFNKWPSLRCSVLDRVINILFDLDDKEKGIKKKIFPETPAGFINRLLKEDKCTENHSYKDIKIKPDKNVKVPKYDLLTEGYNPDKLK